jgi:hypothetical protein
MEQYQQPAARITPPDNTDRKLTESQQKIATLENHVYTLSNTVDLQSRQIRRLESALQLLEALVRNR